MIEQKIYMRKIADMYYDRFLSQGYATEGHNGPHGHIDTPVRNTSYYLIIYNFSIILVMMQLFENMYFLVDYLVLEAFCYRNSYF